MDRHIIEELALSTREALRPGLSALEPAPIDRLLRDVTIAELTVRARLHRGLPSDTWGVTTFEVDRAWIWLNTEAWPELVQGTPRTRFTVAHELGHIVLHGEQLLELHTRPDDEYADQLEREANTFAAHLLVPDAALKRLPTARPETIATRFGVSVLMASRRIEEWRR